MQCPPKRGVVARGGIADGVGAVRETTGQPGESAAMLGSARFVRLRRHKNARLAVDKQADRGIICELWLMMSILRTKAEGNAG